MVRGWISAVLILLCVSLASGQMIMSRHAAGTTYIIDYSPAVLNGGFETSGSPFANWTASVDGTSTVTDDASVFHSGGHSALFTVDGSNSTAELETGTILTAGHTYNVSFWAIKTEATAIVVAVGDATNSTWAYNGDFTTSWVLYTGSFVNGAGNTTLIIKRGSAASTHFNIDDVRVWE